MNSQMFIVTSIKLEHFKTDLSGLLPGVNRLKFLNVLVTSDLAAVCCYHITSEQFTSKCWQESSAPKASTEKKTGLPPLPPPTTTS